MLTDEQQIFDQIAKAGSILITFKKNSKGDAISSALALAIFLKKLDKKVTVASEKADIEKTFSFLPTVQSIKNELQLTKQFIISLDTTNAKAQDISYEIHQHSLDFIINPTEGQFSQKDISSRLVGDNYDLIITLATPDLESLGGIYEHNTEFFFNTPIINIDHHPRNEEYGQINHVKITALATAEVLFDILHTYSAEMFDENISTCLLTGIIAESKSFKIGSLTPNTLTVASRLVNLGARREEIVFHLYQNRDLNTLKLWGRVLAKLQQALVGRIIWSTLNSVDFQKTNSSPDDLSYVIEELIVNVPAAEVIILFTENGEEKIYAQIYTFKNIDAREIMKEYNAIGTKESVRVFSDKPLAEFETSIIDHIKGKLAKLSL